MLLQARATDPTHFGMDINININVIDSKYYNTIVVKFLKASRGINDVWRFIVLCVGLWT